MTLTRENLAVLKRPFPHEDHEFKTGFIYITEEAITNRLEEVDPAWTFERVEMTETQLGTPEHLYEQQIIFTATMTICGCSRTGVGMADAYTKRKEGYVRDPKAEKSAATDALKRCARLFGVGRYLLGIPPKTNERNLQNWLSSLGMEQATDPIVRPDFSSPQNGNGKTTRQKAGVETEKNEADPAREYEVAFTHRTTLERGNSYDYILHTKSDHKVRLFTRELIRKAGYVDGQDWRDRIGERVELEVPIVAKIRWDGKYWEIVPGSIPLFDPGWADLISQDRETDIEF